MNDDDDEGDETSSPGNSFLGINEFTENKLLWKMLASEFIGTMLLVFIGCGSCVGKPTVVMIALTFGLTVATMITLIGHISGCHINPAVTISMFITEDINLVRGTLFILCQCLGAICGAGLLNSLLPTEAGSNIGATIVAVSLHPLNAMVFEIVYTFVLVVTIHTVCDHRRGEFKGSVAFAIGLTVTAIHLTGIQYTGSSLNPARSFGPAVIMNFWEYHWIYWIGPILGAIAAGVVYRFLIRVNKGDDDSSYDF